MTAEIQKFYPADAAKNPDNVLELASGVYETVLILGFDKDGDIDCRASTNLTDRDALWLIEKFKSNMLSGVYNGE